MCGIFGGIGNLDERKLCALGILNRNRGQDSGGVATVNKHITVWKCVGDPAQLFSQQLYYPILVSAKNRIIIGHTRQATQGKINNKNAHPYLSKSRKFAFAHNGIILNAQNFGEFEVDSQTLEIGIEINNFRNYEGSIALCWITKDFLFLLRNSQNPISIGQYKNGIYFSSQDDHLQALGIEVKEKEIQESTIYKFSKTINQYTKIPIIMKKDNFNKINYEDYDFWENDIDKNKLKKEIQRLRTEKPEILTNNWYKKHSYSFLKDKKLF